MPWPANIEQWRKYAIWEGRDIPADLILAIIQHESGGTAGRLSNQTTKSATIERMDGSTIDFNKAMGLMQVIPPNVASWNAQAADKAFFEDMTGASERAARLQIRLGAWIFAANVRLLHDFDSAIFPGVSPGNATEEQLKLALVSYAIGFGNLKPRLEALKNQGLALTLKNLVLSFPKWGYSEKKEQWINRPLHYASIVWDRMTKHGTPAKPAIAFPSNPLSLPDLASIKGAAATLKDNWFWIAIAAVVALIFGSKKGPGKMLTAGPAKIIGRK